MSDFGWYYLHVNGDLIYKRDLPGTDADIRESDFARGLWPCDPSDRMHAWTILVESYAAGARRERILELATRWSCTDVDALEYAKRARCRIFKDGDSWCATREDFVNLQDSPAGFGPTALEAMAQLAQSLGYVPSKSRWAEGFKDLLSKGLPPPQVEA